MTYQIDIVSRIQERFAMLRKSEQKVASVILEDLSFAANASITELAQRAGVSEASITRVAKGVGVKNVRDLKMQLAQSIAVGERFINADTVQPTAVSDVYDTIKRALDLNNGLISNEILNKCSEQIIQANKLLIIGVGGGSTIMAQECENRLFRLGVNAITCSDPMMMRMRASAVDVGDVVLCLSLSGFSPDIAEAALVAKQYGAKVVVISPEFTELFTIADIHIPIVLCETDYIYKPSATRYVMMAAIDVIATDIAVKTQDTTREKLRRIKHNLDLHRKGHKYLPLGD